MFLKTTRGESEETGFCMLYQLAGIVKLNQSLISGLIEVFIMVLVSVGSVRWF